MGHFPQHQNVERLDGREMVNQQDAHQREHRSRREEQRQFHRGVFLAVRPEVQDEPDRIPKLPAFLIGHAQIAFGMTAPHAQQHVHGQDRHFIKEVEEEQVQRHEHPDGRRGQDQQEDIKFLGAILDVPRNEDAREQQNGRCKNQGCPDAIHSDVKTDAQFLGPRPFGDELEAALIGVIGQKHVERSE